MKRWLLVLCVAVVGFAVPARAADADPLLPAESMQVMRVNLKQIIESDIIKKYALANIKQAMEGKDASKMLKELGLDPLKDIESISAGWWGDDPKDMHGVFVLRGKFDGEKIFAAVEKEVQKDGSKMSIVKDGDVKFVKVVVDNLPEPVYATMANEKTIIAGTDKKLVLTAVKLADDKSAKPVLKPALLELYKSMDEKASVVYCGLPGKIGDIPPNPVFDDPEKLKKQLESLVSQSMTVRVGTDVTLDIIMSMKDKEAAEDFGSTVTDLIDKVRTFLPLIAMGQPNAKPVIDDLKKTLKSSVDSKNVKMTVKLSGDAIGKAVGAEE
jgi:hypothetical protein